MIVPPIKSQGIKTKLVPWISDIIARSGVNSDARWIEPFFGTGVVGFNSPLNGERIVGDTNPHIIRFYQSIKDGEINKYTMRRYLEHEGELLSQAADNGYEHFLKVRERFNTDFNPYDFIFLSRSGFNGMMRFNGKGLWNVPFCKKPNRFSAAYTTKICNQVEQVFNAIHAHKWTFIKAGFETFIGQATANDLIYCDPPYYGRYADYYNGWTEEDEALLFDTLSKTKARFILSTWHHNEYRSNSMIDKYWGQFNVMTREHFYHNGAHLENRHAMTEALICNFSLQEKHLNTHIKEGDLFNLNINYALTNKVI